MKIKYIKYLILFLLQTSLLSTKEISANRLKGWLQLDEIKQRMQSNIAKYTTLEAQLKDETNDILEDGIHAADDLADNDPMAALYIYYDMKKLKNKTIESSLDIAKINKRFQELSDYVDQQIKELSNIRRKHLQFPY